MSALRPSCFSCRSFLCRVRPPLLVTVRITVDPASCGRPGRKQRGCAVPKRPTTLSPKEKGERRDQRGRREGAKAAVPCSHLPDKQRQMLCACVRGNSRLEFGCLLAQRGVCPVILSSLLSHANINEVKSFCRGAKKNKKNKPTFACDLLLIIVDHCPSGLWKVKRSKVANLWNWNQISWINLDGFDATFFRFCFVFFLIWSKKRVVLWIPSSTYTSLHHCHFCMKPASQLRQGPPQWHRVCEEFHPLRCCSHPGPTQEDGRLCCQESEESFELETDSEGEGVPGVNVNYYYLHV